MSVPGILATAGVVAKAVPAAGPRGEQEPIRISVQEWAYALYQAGMTDLCSAEANTAGQIPEATFTFLAKMILEKPATVRAFRALTAVEQDQAIAELAGKLKTDFAEYSAVGSLLPESAKKSHQVACDRSSAGPLDRTRPLHITANPAAYTFTLQKHLPGQIIDGIVAARRPVPVVSPDTTAEELLAQLATCEAERAAAATPQAGVCLPEVGAYFFSPLQVCTTDPCALFAEICEQPQAEKAAPPPTQAEKTVQQPAATRRKSSATVKRVAEPADTRPLCKSLNPMAQTAARKAKACRD